MTRRRWIADEVAGTQARLLGAHADHLVRVLRAHVGEECDVAAYGVVHRARIVEIADGRVEFELEDEVKTESTVPVTVLLSIFKFDRMEWAIEKCVELGVKKIVPVIARRTDAHLATAAVKRVERWKRLATQATEQSRRVSPPEITEPVKLANALEFPGAFRIVLAETENYSMLYPLVANCGKGVVLAIGPEGGWTQDELDAFNREGWAQASLGPTILRAETAAIAATAIAMAAAK